ncbi:MAG TPA: asparagine--tRNA ligase [Candidatus Nanoarchaeia archaeon]|nr:asparagine--tRNA ligase [Candidatus Nanoarchaeia archaeon]
MSSHKFVSIQEAITKGKGIVSVHGWCYRERGSNELKFIVIRDSSNILQCVVEKSKVSPAVWKDANSVHIETSLEITGNLKKDDRAPTGYEITVKDLHIVGSCDNFPIQKDQSIEFLADNRHLWLRSRKMTAILKIRSTVFGAIHHYFRDNDFYEFQSPIFQPTQAEGGSTVFEVPYFGDTVYLAQTWQLQAEAAMFALEKIYTIAPSFRAEKSKTSRHLTEYWHAEMEMAWCTFEDLQNHAEALLKSIVQTVLKENKKELNVLGRDVKKLEPLVKKKFKRMTYDDALDLLKNKANISVPWGKDLRTVEEDALSELFDVPIIVTRYPKEVKAFYMKEDPKNSKEVLGFDVIAPEHYGEIIGASQREENIDKIKENLIKHGEDPKNYEFYLDTRRYGSVPHGGFGLGVERMVSWICGLDNIKDAIPFPRTMFRYRP